MSADVFLSGSRIELCLDGHVILGFSVKERPKNHAEMAALLRECVAALESPEVPDPHFGKL